MSVAERYSQVEDSRVLRVLGMVEDGELHDHEKAALLDALKAMPRVHGATLDRGHRKALEQWAGHGIPDDPSTLDNAAEIVRSVLDAHDEAWRVVDDLVAHGWHSAGECVGQQALEVSA